MLSSSPQFRHIGVGAAIAITALAVASVELDLATAQSDPESAVLLSLWLTAVILTIWLVASLAYWRRRLSSPHTGPHWLDRFALPGSKRLAQGMLAASLTILPACGPSGPTTPQLSYVGEVETSQSPLASPSTIAPPSLPPTTERNVTTTTPTTGPTATKPPTSTTEPPTTALPTTDDEPADTTVNPARSDETPTTHTVVPGDHLWGIAEATMATRLGHQPSTSEITGYWKVLIDANADSLSSGNASLIYPGETLELPTQVPGTTP